MSETRAAHTPGPWEVQTINGSPSAVRICAQSTYQICRIQQSRTADIALIAAAPTLLAALQDVVAAAAPNQQEHPAMYAAWVNARAAIASATVPLQPGDGNQENER